MCSETENCIEFIFRRQGNDGPELNRAMSSCSDTNPLTVFYLALGPNDT